MRRPSFVDLTPLLDVVLIILFAFMFNMTLAGEQRDEAVKEREQAISVLETEIESLEASKELVNESVEAIDTLLQQVLDGEIDANELMKYREIANQYIFVDVQLKGKNHALFINGRSLGRSISFDDVIDKASRDQLVLEIARLIYNQMNTLEKGYRFALLSIYVDQDSSRYAVEVVRDALFQVQLLEKEDYILVNQTMMFDANE